VRREVDFLGAKRLETDWLENFSDSLPYRSPTNHVSIPGKGKAHCLLFETSKLALGPTHLTIQWAPGDISAEVNRPEREAGFSAASTEVNNESNYTSTPPYTFMTRTVTTLQSFLPLP
jgi:hypothetical protein